MTSTPDPDDRLIGAHDLALAALQEITPSSSIGPAAGYVVEDDGSVSLRFENRLPGYPGWYWTVTVARVDDAEPTVLEVELLPNEGALLAPEWVPWAERLAEYRAHQAELAEQAAAAEQGDEDELEGDDADDLDEDADDEDDVDEDEDPSEARVLHAGDLDGVDIDELDDSVVEDIADAADDDEDESEEDESEDESDEDSSEEE
ncbi:hypothetical protein HD600_000483 [Microbacterium ginsengiterrae]|uniref:DUF3027 family protein n=1 Tax=Microbacterium ginsengiterrae TaxID=546115 RepID=A0A7W9FA83_9MICO|nr:DUF3027 domain-containing protein [Microbacterium ginsengiterrae]MBB5741986.1 hypothetical protein [Microbacterium ginsengiterrae]